MKVLATYRPERFMPPEAAQNRDDLAKIGWLAGEDSQHVLAIVDGIEVRRHPAVSLAEASSLWRIVDEFTMGARRKVRSQDYDRLSNFHLIAIRTMSAARGRALEEKEPEHGDGE